MATLTTYAASADGTQAGPYAPGSLRNDWIAAALGAWGIGGAFLDGWAHSHGKVDNVFFTPWHAILYSGALAFFAFLALLERRGRAQSYDLWHALPKGYALSVIGRGVFMAGGALYVFSFLVPVVYFGPYFAVLQLTQGIEWTIHLWLGTIFMAGAAGLFVSLLMALATNANREAVT